MRSYFVLVHRYVGLTLAVFLLIAGLTGTLLVWYHELDTAVNAQLMIVQPPHADARPMDPFVLREQVQAVYPEALVHYVDLDRAPDEAASFYLDGRTNAAGEPAELPNDQVFVNPYTGQILGERRWGDITQGMTNLMPFLYRLHYSLALNTLGTYLFGVIALLWTLDCFMAVYLTFPAQRRGTARTSWWIRWWPSWKVRWRGGPYKVNFDLHRAGSLWLWAMLFVFAWSSVSLNLSEVYRPVMGALFEVHRDPYQRFDQIRKLAVPQDEPGIPWHAAHERAQMLMAELAENQQFTVLKESRINYDSHHALYRYRVKSDHDISDKYSATTLWLDSNTGQFVDLIIPTGQASGDTITRWLYALHFADVFGLPYRIFVCLLGLAVSMLSVTGVYIWWRKRQARQKSSMRRKDVAGVSNTAHNSKTVAPAHAFLASWPMKLRPLGHSIYRAVYRTAIIWRSSHH